MELLRQFDWLERHCLAVCRTYFAHGRNKSDRLLAMAYKSLARFCRLFALLAFFTASFAAGVAAGSAEPSLEYPVKGAYLFKFGAFIDWPRNAFPEPSTPFTIAILGEDPFGVSLNEIVQ